MSTVLETMSNQNANNWLAMGNVGVSCTHAGGAASSPPVGTAVTGQVVNRRKFNGLGVSTEGCGSMV